jgi:AcrR family transcriptional regulator
MASITRGSPQTGNRRVDTAEQVLDAVERLLAAGEVYTELGVQRIAREAGIARSSFYMHFPDKTQLLLTLARRVSVGAFDAHAAWEPDADDALERMVEGFEVIVAHYRRHAPVLSAVLEVSGYDRDVAEFWGRQLDAFRGRMQGWLRAEQEAGRTASGLDTESAVRVVVDGGMRTIADQVANGHPSDDARIAGEMARVWWYGVFRRP